MNLWGPIRGEELTLTSNVKIYRWTAMQAQIFRHATRELGATALKSLLPDTVTTHRHVILEACKKIVETESHDIPG